MRSEATGDIKKYIDENIGQIISVNGDGIYVKYPNPKPKTQSVIDLNKRLFSRSQLVEFAPTIQKLQQKILANKYNL